MHSHNSNCIYSIAESNGDSIEFSLSIAEQRAVGFIPAWSLASLQEHRIYPELDLGRRCRCNLGRLQRGQQAGKAWLGVHLDCITPIRFGVGGADKGQLSVEGP